jgi:DNA-binding transcriptional LysR family regulator
MYRRARRNIAAGGCKFAGGAAEQYTAAMNWDDLRIILAVRDEGSYARAAAKLRVDETTVSRRLARIERSLGVSLFEAVDGMRELTTQGEMIASHIQAMAQHVTDISAVGKREIGPVGRFRIALVPSIAEQVLAPGIADLLVANPGLTLQLLTAAEKVNFSRWQADMAVRLVKPEKGDFTIQKLADTQLYFFEPSDKGEGAQPVVCCYPGLLDGLPESQFLASRGLHSAARCITDNPRVIRSLIRSHYGVGILPDYLCHELLADPRLQVTPLPRRRGTWLLVQPHLKGNAAARIVIDWMRTRFAKSTWR